MRKAKNVASSHYFLNPFVYLLILEQLYKFNSHVLILYLTEISSYLLPIIFFISVF